MAAKNRLRIGTLVGVLLISASMLSGQGRGGPVGQLPDSPVATPIPEVRPVPGAPFPGVIMDLPAGDDLDHFDYEMGEYFVSGTAQGKPYTTRILLRKPFDDGRSSGIVVAEGMHPSGNSWMFHFTHTYVMSQGHVGLEIVTSGLQHFTNFDEDRYGSLSVDPDQTNDIIAQVGALMKSPSSPLEGLDMRRMILMGTSASAGILIRYLPAHEVLRQADMSPIFDGFLPTSNISQIRNVDVPLIQIPTMTEVERLDRDAQRRPDGDAAGDQFRVYEFAGMSHNDSRVNRTYFPDPCRYPVSQYPLGAFMSAGLNHLIQWTDSGTVPPRADKLLLDFDSSDGSALALDEFGNARGGIRNTYVDLPTMKYSVRNEGADPPISNPSRMLAARPVGTANQLCGLAGYETPLSAEQLQSLYDGAPDYRMKVAGRLRELALEGWFLPVYRDLVMGDANAADIP
jgi:hypothetical protein